MFIAATVLVAAVLLGGAARADSPANLILRPLLVILAVVAILFCRSTEMRRAIRPVAWCLGALALLMAIQMVPLPPLLWTMLPGHRVFVDAAIIMGQPQPWRPLSIAPDLTLSSLLSLLPVAALLIAIERLSVREMRKTLDLLVGLLAAGLVLDVIQASTGALYLHQYTYPGSAVGFFSNRNHEAALLAMGYPMLRLWIARPDHRGDPRIRPIVAGGIALLILPAILLTGSRAGLALAVIGLVAALVVAPLPIDRMRRRGWRIGAGLLAGAGIVSLAALLWAQRAVSIERFAAAGDMHGELRLRTLPTLMNMIGRYFPTGSGFGTFDPAFRMAEPDSLLKPTYFNHAHNEPIELFITGGVPALLILMVFIGILVMAALRGWCAPDERMRAFARAGSAIWLILGVASIVDYPLRTAHMMVVATIATVWILLAARSRHVPVASSGAPAVASREPSRYP